LPGRGGGLPGRGGGSPCRGGAANVAVLEEHHIAMTRSLGDFTAHTCGVSAEPQVRTVELPSLCTEKRWARVALLVASDGVWDMWGHDEIVDHLLPVGGEGKEALMLGGAFAEATRARSADYFEESADNLTGVLRMLDVT
jgi:serine/threonine protein phosphatase PrpC